MNRFVRGIVQGLPAVLIVLGSIGCAKAPTEEITQADQSLEQARTAQAADYAPEALQAAEDARIALEDEVKAQEESFAPFRSYDKAKELAVAAKTAADTAAQDAAAGRERAREEAAALIAEVNAKLEEVRTMLDNAPRGKGNQADLTVLRSDLQGVESSLPEIDRAFAEERFLECRAKAQAAWDSTDRVREEIARAIELSSSKRRPA